MRNYDWPLLSAVGFLAAMGLVNLYSVEPEFFGRQIIWVLLGAAAIFIVPVINLKPLFTYRWAILGVYFASLLLLLAANLFAQTIANTKSWLVFGGFNLQPSEFGKIALIILLSSFFAAKHIAIRRVSIVFASFIYFALPAGLVMLQPDLGTALILFAIWFGYLLVNEIPVKNLFAIFIVFGTVAMLAWNFGLQGYQKERIRAVFDPTYDPLGVNYNVIQSKIAIGSAGFLGKGFKQGTQSQLGFLPEKGNDFAFAAFTEEWGLMGALALIAAFTFMVYRILILGTSSDNNFSKLMELGTCVMLTAHFAVNVGSNLGLLPVVGVSFPFLSYGVSNLLTSSMLIGIILNTAKRRSGF